MNSIDVKNCPTVDELLKEACRLLVGLAKYDNGQLVGFCQDGGEVYNYLIESIAARKEKEANEHKE